MKARKSWQMARGNKLFCPKRRARRAFKLKTNFAVGAIVLMGRPNHSPPACTACNEVKAKAEVTHEHALEF
eukprot:scaffold107072_cov15-Tisochrysis_lutea.AAC.1